MISNAILTVIARTAGKPESLSSTLRGEVWAVDKDQSVFDLKTMDQILSEMSSQRRFNMLLLGVFSSLALTLAAVGIYGVMSYSVAQRTHEIGIRMALGARRTDVLGMVVMRGMMLTAAGIGVGLIGAMGLTWLMSSLLYGVSPTDPLTFVVIPILLGAVALGACFVPARRATKVDPMIALRYE